MIRHHLTDALLMAYAAGMLPEQAELMVEVRATGLQYEIRARLYGLPVRSLITQRNCTARRSCASLAV